MSEANMVSNRDDLEARFLLIPVERKPYCAVCKVGSVIIAVCLLIVMWLHVVPNKTFCITTSCLATNVSNTANFTVQEEPDVMGSKIDINKVYDVKFLLEDKDLMQQFVDDFSTAIKMINADYKANKNNLKTMPDSPKTLNAETILKDCMSRKSLQLGCFMLYAHQLVEPPN